MVMLERRVGPELGSCWKGASTDRSRSSGRSGSASGGDGGGGGGGGDNGACAGGGGDTGAEATPTGGRGKTETTAAAAAAAAASATAAANGEVSPPGEPGAWRDPEPYSFISISILFGFPFKYFFMIPTFQHYIEFYKI